MRIFAALALIILPYPLIAQEVCEAPRPSIMPDCTAGVWYGESNLADKLREILPNAPGSTAHISENTGKNLFMRIFADGFYVTGTLTANAVVRLNGSDETNIQYDFVTTPTVGWMGVRADNKMDYFCANEGTSDGILSVTTGGHSSTMTASSLPATGYKPEIEVLCEGDTMRMLIELPPPINTATYSFRRIPESGLPDYVQELYESRMGD